MEVDGKDLGHHGLHLAEVLGDAAGDADFLIGLLARDFKAQARQRLPDGFQRFQCLFPGHVDQHKVDHRAADDAVQGDQDGQGQEAPEAAAHRIDVLLFIELLDLHRIAFLVVSAALFDLLHARIHPGHVHRIALGFRAGIEHDQLDDHGKQDDGQAIGACEGEQDVQQLGKRPHYDSQKN